MANVQDLDAKIAEFRAAVSEQGDTLAAALDRVSADVEFLKGQVSPDLQAQIDSINEGLVAMRAATDALRALDPIPENPPTEG